MEERSPLILHNSREHASSPHRRRRRLFRGLRRGSSPKSMISAPIGSDDSFTKQSAATSSKSTTRNRGASVRDIVPDGIADFVKAEQRLQKGECPSCGQLLYKIKGSSRGLLGRWLSSSQPPAHDSPNNSTRLRKIPLTTSTVLRGQCLACIDKQLHGSNTTTSCSNTAASSTQPGTATGNNLHDEGIVLHRDPTISTLNDSITTPATAIYHGSFNAFGERHGTGHMTWSNGDKYVGNFSHGVRSGPGTLHFADGSEYVGTWSHNVMHGHGTRRFVNGDIYVGDYLDGKRQGQGRFYFGNGDLYVGAWQNDDMHGFGRYYYHSGTRFEGLFAQGQRHGKGKIQKPDGSLDIYRYQRDKKVGGFGVRWSPDRTQAWKLVLGRYPHSPITLQCRRIKVTVVEAVSLVYEIENNADVNASSILNLA